MSLELELVSDTRIPLVHFNVYFRVGPSLDPPGKEGLTTLTNRALLRGTQSRGRVALEEAIEALGTELMTSTQRQAVGLGGTVLRRHLPAFAALLVEVVTQPAFAPDEIEKVKREMIAELAATQDEDSQLAGRWFRRILFAGGPAAHGTHGWPQSLARLTRADVVAHHARFYTRSRLVVGVSGAIARPELNERLAPLLADLPAGTKAAWPAVRPADGGETWIVDRPDRTQGQILLGHPVIDATHPDSLALGLATNAFGGTFTARLMQEVRVKRGLSYGAYARMTVERSSSMYCLSAAPEAADLANTLALLRSEFARFVDEGLTDEEVRFSRDYLKRSFAFAVETPALEAGQRVRARLLDRPPDYVDTYIDRVAALDAETVRAAVRRHLRPTAATAVVVCTARGSKVAGRLTNQTVPMR